MNFDAFYPQGNTVLVAASSSTGLAPTQISTANVAGVVLSNPSTVTIYVAFGSSTIAASQPTTAAPGAGMAIPAGALRSLGLNSNPTYAWLSAVTSAGAAAPGLFATPGQGLL